MSGKHTMKLELPVCGMDCAGCARTVRQAVEKLPGVRSAEVLLSAEKAVIELDPAEPATLDAVRQAIEATGHTVPLQEAGPAADERAQDIARRVFWLFGLIFGVVLLVVVAGEWLGLFESITDRVPWPAGVFLVLLLGYPVFKQVARAALKRRVIAHTLMTMGALAALVAGEWATAAVVVFFMRVGDYAEHFTTERARESVRSLTRMAPKTARVERNGEEQEVLAEEVQPDDVVIVRPGEQIPVDGDVLAGQATINQATITGESMPIEAAPGARVYAATIAELGALRIRATAVGRDTTFGRVIRMVEEAEAHRGDVQRMADRFSAYYLPVVALVATMTFVLRQDVMATVAVLVVACSCAFALATPVAILASVGAAARRGLLIKGGKYLELLARADIVLLDKTGTLTLGQPRITNIVSLNGLSEDELLTLAASAERYSEHPLAGAVRQAARDRGLPSVEPDAFEAVPGQGIRAYIDGRQVAVGSARLAVQAAQKGSARRLENEGKTLLFVDVDGEAAGVLAAADTERAEVPEALTALRRHGIGHIELLTGDNEQTAAALANRLRLRYRADLLPEDKIEIVRQYQAEGHTVVMIGDGVNDAPALAQADVGIAMGAAGTDVAIEAAHVALMRDDWRLVPDLFDITRCTMQVVKLNIGFTALYNLAGLTLAALGFLPPILAAAAQSLPDLGILANSARLIRQK
ncbi:MAG: heavy metal translocating P-type ATPase [Rhodothermales bacterium]